MLSSKYKNYMSSKIKSTASDKHLTLSLGVHYFYILTQVKWLSQK